MTKSKRKRGRPALGPGKGRESVVVSFRLTRQEAKALDAAAKVDGTSRAVFVWFLVQDFLETRAEREP